MKTLLVLCVLLGVALASPAVSKRGFTDTIKGYFDQATDALQSKLKDLLEQVKGAVNSKANVLLDEYTKKLQEQLDEWLSYSVNQEDVEAFEFSLLSKVKQEINKVLLGAMAKVDEALMKVHDLIDNFEGITYADGASRMSQLEHMEDMLIDFLADLDASMDGLKSSPELNAYGIDIPWDAIFDKAAQIAKQQVVELLSKILKEKFTLTYGFTDTLKDYLGEASDVLKDKLSGVVDQLKGVVHEKARELLDEFTKQLTAKLDRVLSYSASQEDIALVKYSLLNQL